jgi:hypothetical protein
MQFFHFEMALVAIILAILLFFVTKYLGKALGVLIVTAGAVALLIRTPAASGLLNYAYNLAMGAVH